MRLLGDDEVDRLYVEVPQGIKRRSTNMSSLLCGTLCSTIVCTTLPFAYLFCRVAKTFLRNVRPTVRGANRLGKRAQSVGGLAEGLYPFPFRTRQSSLLAAMVLIVTDGESS